MNFFRCFLSILVITSQPSLLPAADVEDQFEFQFYQQAQSSSELRQRTQLVRDFKVLRRSCEMQMAQNLLPSGCYQLQSIMQKIQALSKTRTVFADEHIKQVTEIDEFCMKSVQATDLLEISTQLKNSLSPQCYEALKKRVTINRYKRGQSLSF